MSDDAPWHGRGRRIHVREVGTRDGLQNEAVFVATADKIALVNALSRAGFSSIEVTAFVSAQAIPALRDADVVLREIERHPGVVYAALVANMRGAERAIEARADELNVVMSVSETHNLANLRMTRARSLEVLSEVVVRSARARTAVNLSLSCSFGCPLEGEIGLDDVLDLARRFIDQGVAGITLCDTTGMAYPSQVIEFARAFRSIAPEIRLSMHFHDTRGMGLANILAAIAAGVHRFDASIAGLGGCPYAPGASGNVCTEEVVHALEWMGYTTGIDQPALLAAAARLPAWVGHDVPSQILKAGHRLQRNDLARAPHPPAAATLGG